ncbi:MAG: copper chaperone [Alphaproteobacteria bacterium]|nr:copper chaperone [Alphaproteobacteria bacterium]
MSQSYRVAGMTCQGCVSAVTRAIQRRLPDAKVAVDLLKGIVAVEATGLADDMVKSAVTDAGFTYGGVAV